MEGFDSPVQHATQDFLHINAKTEQMWKRQQGQTYIFCQAENTTRNSASIL